MQKLEAAQWYSYHSNGDMTNLQEYYKEYKYWFDQNKYDHQYDLAPTTCTSREVPCVEGPDPRHHDTVNFDWIRSPECDGWKPVLKQKEKGNNPMYIEDMIFSVPCASTKKCVPPQANAASVIQVITDSKPDIATDQRKHLENRVYAIKYSKHVEIAEQFHRDEPAGPTTVAELKERLKKGLYTVELPKCYDEDEAEIYWRDAFSWRTPETQYDKDGYDAAHKELATFIEDILDQIAILDPKEGLALLDDLKKWKPTKAKK